MTRLHKHSAFTLVEMLLAMTLTAFLLAAVSVLIGQMAASAEQMRQRKHEPFWIDGLVDCLRTDLQMAESLSMEPKRLIIQANLSLHIDTDESALPKHRPITVTYALKDIDGRQYLIRSEQNRTELSNRINHREIFASDIVLLHFMSAIPERDNQWQLNDVLGQSEPPGNVPESQSRNEPSVAVASREETATTHLYVEIQTNDMDKPIRRIVAAN